MANVLYDLGRESFLKGEISWSGDTIAIALVDSALYTPNLATDQFLSDVVAGGAVIASFSGMTSKTTATGVADAADVTFSAVTGAVSEYLVVYQDTTVAGTSRLIGLLDSAGVTGLPVTPNGGDIQITFDSGANKIFKL
jgi:hypothetical protein